MLAAKININVVGKDRALDLRKASQQEKKMYIRKQGTSRSGPCPECAVWFNVVHDMSGDVVPLVQLHNNCVCWDMLLEMSETIEPDEKPVQPGEWLKEKPEAQKTVLKKQTQRALQYRLIKIKDALKTTATRFGEIGTVELVRKLSALGIDKLQRVARKVGMTITDTRSATKSELIQFIMYSRGV